VLSPTKYPAKVLPKLIPKVGAKYKLTHHSDRSENKSLERRLEDSEGKVAQKIGRSVAKTTSGSGIGVKIPHRNHNALSLRVFQKSGKVCSFKSGVKSS
jgi:hypothetical protein